MYKKYAIVWLAVLLPLGLWGQQFSSTFNEDYEIFGFSPAYGYKYVSLTPRQLLEENNFLTPEQGKETPRASLLKKSVQQGTLSFTLILMLKDTKVAKMQVNIQTDEFAEKNYITYVAVANLLDGQQQAFRYKGDEESLGECIGALQSLLKLFYNLEKLNPAQ